MKAAVGKSELANRGFGLVLGRFWHRAQRLNDLSPEL